MNERIEANVDGDAIRAAIAAAALRDNSDGETASAETAVFVAEDTADHVVSVN